jgi:LDH2 family malate/lactate/ureidoglycolate dehydrogenase
MSDPATRTVEPAELRQLVTGILARRGMPEHDAALVADTLVEADLRGVRSHGVMRVPRYVRELESGEVKARPDIRIVMDAGPIAAMDGDGGMGQVSADAAMRLAMKRAGESGVGVVTLRNSRHCGAMAYWAMLALPAHCIGFATTNAGMNMAPYGGKDRLVGNNPFAMAVPTARPWAMVLDMATSIVAGGKLDIAAIQGRLIPSGCALDPDGNPTTDPVVARKGTLLPVGGPKGYGMALMLDVLAGVLSGGRFGGRLGPAGDGQFFLALKVERFIDLAEFYARMDAVIDQIHASALAPGFDRIYVPGEIEYETRERRLREGMPVEENLLAHLESL